MGVTIILPLIKLIFNFVFLQPIILLKLRIRLRILISPYQPRHRVRIRRGFLQTQPSRLGLLLLMLNIYVRSGDVPNLRLQILKSILNLIDLVRGPLQRA